MKKLITGICLTALLVSGCGSQADFLQPYTVVTSSKTTDVSTMLEAEAFKGFAADLGVISIEDTKNSADSDALSGVTSSESFLAGTTDHTVLAASNIYTEMPPASITKILTALVTLKYGGDLDQEITLTDACYVDVADAQICGYAAGDVVTLKTLLYSMLIYSGNDAANAIAYAVGNGSISDFCDMMNKEAKSLGATHTNFVTPNGLDNPDHYTTAYDLYLIFNECLKYPEFKDAINQSSYTGTYTHNGASYTATWPSTNYYLLGNAAPPDGITIVGGKTGTTDNAGLCLILYVEDTKGNGYISVLLGSPDKDTLYTSMSNLLSNIRN